MKKANKTEEKKRNPLQRSFLLFALFVLMIVSGLAITQTVSAGVDQNGDGSIDPYETCLGSAAGASCTPAWYSFCNTRVDPKCSSKPALCTDGVSWGTGYQRVCVATGKCTDNDKDGKETCSPSKDASLPPAERRDDCDDNDPWSHRYASANIQSVSVDFDPDYLAQTKTVRLYTPIKPFSLRDTIKTTVTFTKKCGMKPPGPNDALSKPMSVYIVRGDGVEIPVSGEIYQKYDPVKDVYVDYVYEVSKDLREIMTEDSIAAIAKNPSWRLKLVGPDLVDDFRGAIVPPNVIKDTPKYQPLPMKNYTKALIVVGGFGAPARHKIFSTIGSLAPGSIKIPLRLKSVARNTVKIREEVNNQLNKGNEVLVVGHSLGSLIAYNLQKEFRDAGKCVEGLYIDPPYDFLLCKIPLVNLIPAVASFKKSCEGIESDPNTINWTGGKGLLYFFDHDAFTFPNHGNNKQKVEDLKTIVKSRLKDGGNSWRSGCSLGSVPPPVLLKSPPKITNISSVSIRPGESITITGSGFSPAGNIIDLQNGTYVHIYYELFNLISTNNGNTLTFVLPPSPVPPVKTIPGKYFLKVSAVGSDWSNALTVEVKK